MIDEDEDEIAEQREHERLLREREIDDIRNLLERRDFRDFAWRMLDKCRIYDDGFAADHATMAFASGRRHVGLWLLGELTTAEPHAYVNMQIEHGDRE